jgi:hypothetical protein
VTVAVAVCAHPSRAEVATALAEKLEAPVAWDNGVGILANHDNAFDLAMVDACFDDADWCVVIEDDAVPVEDFRVQASLALDAVDGPIASLYFGWIWKPKLKITLSLDRTDAHWVMRPGFTNAVCVAVRSDFVAPLLEAAQPFDHMTCDQRYSYAAKLLGHEWVPHSHPSLVEHSDIPGVHGACGIPRHAYRVGSRQEWLGGRLCLTERVWE